MKFMILMNTKSDGYGQYLSWPKDVLDANIAFMSALTKRLEETGELVASEGLASPRSARLVRRGNDGAPVTDGVFPEGKEFLAGWWIIDVENEERAFNLAAEISSAPGPALSEPMWIEVRQVMGSHRDLR